MNALESYPSVQIVLLNWNGWRDTVECVQSLRGLTYPNFGITVVDNASTDDSVARIAPACPDVRFLTCAENLGFAGGNNVGIRDALAQAADYVWILNNDTLVDPESLTELIRTAELAADIGVVGPKIYYADAPNFLWFAGALYRPFWGQPVMQGFRQEDIGAEWQTDGEAAFITGCAMLGKADTFGRVGMLNEAFFYGMEDVDFGLRAHTAGLRSVVAARARIEHKVSSASGGAESPLNMYYAARNRLLLVRKHGRWFHWPTFLLHFAFSYGVQYGLAALRGRRSFACCRAILLGVLDFARGDLGLAPTTLQMAGRIKPQSNDS